MRCKCRRKLVRNGFTPAGTQRWKCLACNHTKIRQKWVKPSTSLLIKYLIEGQTISLLSNRYHLHPNTVRGKVLKLISSPPPAYLTPLPKGKIWIATDATHFKSWGCLYITKATGIPNPIAVSFCRRECLETALTHLKPLTGLLVNGYTTDGRKGLVMAHKQVFPNGVHQRCLIHIQMRVQTLLTQNPKLKAGRDLLGLSSQLHEIRDYYQAEIWLLAFQDWYEIYRAMLVKRTYQTNGSWWYTHRNLRFAWKHILNAADNLFVFLDHENSTYHNNHLEGTFGQRKPALFRHRGLSRTKIAAALIWTFYLLSQPKKNP
jgi:hypothetical protein